MRMKRQRISSSSSVEFDHLHRIKKDERSTTTTSESQHCLLPDDVLCEIFIRLPNLRSLIQCKTVSKYWFSLIKSNLIQPTLLHHLKSKIQPLTLLFPHDFISGNPIRILHQNSPPPPPTNAATVLNFFPCLNNSFTKDSTTALVATCDDLLLFRAFNSYHVANPLTGQTFLLPPTPHRLPHGARFGLVSEPNNNHNNNNGDDHKELGPRKRFRVMLMFDLERKKKKKNNGNDIITCITVFNSETWQWMTSQITRRNNNNLDLSSVNHDVVAWDGGLYWLGNSRLVAFYPFRSPHDAGKRWLFIDFPAGFNYAAFSCDIRAHLRLGLFEGRPRLSRLFSVGRSHLCLEVWDLRCNNGDGGGGRGSAASLNLVHRVRIKGGEVYVLAFHPTHTHHIFLLRDDCHVYQYDMETDEEIAKVAEIIPRFYFFHKPDLHVFPFLFPARPSLIQRVV